MSGRTKIVARELARHVVAFLLNWRARLSSDRAGCVLVYHGVADQTGDGDREIVPSIGQRTLARHLRLLARRYRVVPSSSIAATSARRRRGGRIPLAITFDDDLASHVSHAAPLLRELELPAAFFLCGSMASNTDGFWWEHVQRAVDEARLRPGDIPGVPEQVIADAIARRPGAISEIAEIVETLPPAERSSLGSSLATGGEAEAHLDREGVRALARDGFELGFHTLRHDRLPQLAPVELEAAMEDGRRELEEVIGRRLTMISYPHGRADERVARAARDAGFAQGFVGNGRRIEGADDPLLLSRLVPTFETTGVLALQLARYLRRGELRR